MVEYPEQNHQSTTASMRQEHQCGESANLLEHGGIDHQNNANDILALFQWSYHCYFNGMALCNNPRSYDIIMPPQGM